MVESKEHTINSKRHRRIQTMISFIRSLKLCKNKWHIVQLYYNTIKLEKTKNDKIQQDYSVGQATEIESKR